jgi:hypothetical protein
MMLQDFNVVAWQGAGGGVVASTHALLTFRNQQAQPIPEVGMAGMARHSLVI